jgi:hypothetical protein
VLLDNVFKVKLNGDPESVTSVQTQPKLGWKVILVSFIGGALIGAVFLYACSREIARRFNMSINGTFDGIQGRLRSHSRGFSLWVGKGGEGGLGESSTFHATTEKRGQRGGPGVR